MKVFKKFIAVLCSATLVLAAPLTAFAADPDPVASAEGTAGTAGAGNVLSYNFDTVVVPTTIKITFNPQGLKVAKRTDDIAVTDQIVSLNYGIASKASMNKKVIVKFAANTTLNGTSSDVVFVDDEDKVAAKDETHADGAVTGEHKIYLTVAPASEQPKYYDPDSTETDKGEAFAVTPVAATADDPGKNTDNVTAANLSDVVMTAATAGVQNFVTAETSPKNAAYAILGYKLTKATYEAMTDLSFDTTADQVADKMEITALGQISGFTFSGAMNTNTDWTKANLSAISITPIYELQDEGEEEAVTGTHGVITLTAAADNAEPDKPLSADEIAAATAASGFKAAQADVLALTADTVTGSEEEQAAITAAIAAFGELSAGAKAILAAEDPAITAETLGALKTASEAAGVTEYPLTYMSATGNLKYTFTSDIPSGSLTSVKINGTDRPNPVNNGYITYNASTGEFIIKKVAVDNTDLGITQGSTTVIATIGGAEYTFTY